jgi:hypothetical protein
MSAPGTAVTAYTINNVLAIQGKQGPPGPSGTGTGSNPPSVKLSAYGSDGTGAVDNAPAFAAALAALGAMGNGGGTIEVDYPGGGVGASGTFLMSSGVALPAGVNITIVMDPQCVGLISDASFSVFTTAANPYSVALYGLAIAGTADTPATGQIALDMSGAQEFYGYGVYVSNYDTGISTAAGASYLFNTLIPSSGTTGIKVNAPASLFFVSASADGTGALIESAAGCFAYGCTFAGRDTYGMRSVGTVGAVFSACTFQSVEGPAVSFDSTSSFCQFDSSNSVTSSTTDYADANGSNLPSLQTTVASASSITIKNANVQVTGNTTVTTVDYAYASSYNGLPFDVVFTVAESITILGVSCVTGKAYRFLCTGGASPSFVPYV